MITPNIFAHTSFLSLFLSQICSPSPPSDWAGTSVHLIPHRTAVLQQGDERHLVYPVCVCVCGGGGGGGGGGGRHVCVCYCFLDLSFQAYI